MSLSSFFGFTALTVSDSELPEIFPLPLKLKDFVDADVVTVYSKILTDCIDRTQGIPEDVAPLLWDNFLQNESSYGLISHLACAMATKSDLFLVYIPALKVLRLAEPEEEIRIEDDYAVRGQSSVGVFVSFKNYKKTDMVKIYSNMEYCVVASLNKMMNLSKAIQFKMNDMRGGVSLTDSSVATNQAKAIAKGLSNGRDVIVDAKDEVITGTPDISSIKESIMFLDAKRSFYYGMPLSYINGEQTAGIGSTGEADMRAVERGLKQYFISIVNPVLEALFGISVTFKSNDFRQIGSALEALKSFELVSDDLMSREDKQLIIAKLFDLDQKAQ